MSALARLARIASEGVKRRGGYLEELCAKAMEEIETHKVGPQELALGFDALVKLPREVTHSISYHLADEFARTAPFLPLPDLLSILDSIGSIKMREHNRGRPSMWEVAARRLEEEATLISFADGNRVIRAYSRVLLEPPNMVLQSAIENYLKRAQSTVARLKSSDTQASLQEAQHTLLEGIQFCDSLRRLSKLTVFERPPEKLESLKLHMHKTHVLLFDLIWQIHNCKGSSNFLHCNNLVCFLRSVLESKQNFALRDEEICSLLELVDGKAWQFKSTEVTIALWGCCWLMEQAVRHNVGDNAGDRETKQLTDGEQAMHVGSCDIDETYRNVMHNLLCLVFSVHFYKHRCTNLVEIAHSLHTVKNFSSRLAQGAICEHRHRHCVDLLMMRTLAQLDVCKVGEVLWLLELLNELQWPSMFLNRLVAEERRQTIDRIKTVMVHKAQYLKLSTRDLLSKVEIILPKFGLTTQEVERILLRVDD
eukprot:Platyproteum_vivax@DN6815_c0_g1_i2.p1